MSNTNEDITEAPEFKHVVLEGMDWMRVFSACQALMMPTGVYPVTHKRCREILRELLGFCPKGRPGTPLREGSKFRKGGAEAINEWLGVVDFEHHRQSGGAVVKGDRTHLLLRV